ncbi:MAG: hypothetical protein K0S26_928 [Bacteroidota bacterium]|jgi:hypothetical protein|nr:hypothetical protein [Bacteroidota bacterium]
MQTDILQKQLHSSLQELKTAIEKFEKHPSPSTQYAEQLHTAIHASNKLVSAYLVLKEHKDISPDLNLHIKLMNVPTPEEKSAIIEPIKEQVIVEQTAPVKNEVKSNEVTKEEPVAQSPEMKLGIKELPKMAININDKFRFINELFASNATEYNIAIEQINTIHSMDELNNYLKGLSSIYMWKEDQEVVKNLFALAKKRFS